MLIDTPGMRELGILGADDGIQDSYADIGTLLSGCRFQNCSHTNEPGCALLEALENGTLDREHYNNYVKIKKELIDIINIQLKDNQKARILDSDLNNNYVPSLRMKKVKSQVETHHYLIGKK